MSAGINFIFKDKDYFFLRILSAVTMWKKTKFLARYEVFHRRNTLTDELITHGRFLNDGFLIFSYEFLNHKFFRFFFYFILFFFHQMENNFLEYAWLFKKGQLHLNILNKLIFRFFKEVVSRKNTKSRSSRSEIF